MNTLPVQTFEERIKAVRNGLQDSEYTPHDWRHEVASRDTVLGYADWVEHQLESDKFDKTYGVDVLDG